MGSLMMRSTFSPAIRPASFVACLWLSLKYAAQADMFNSVQTVVEVQCTGAVQVVDHLMRLLAPNKVSI